MSDKEYFGKKMLIGGELVESVSGTRFSSVNPANEEVIGDAPEGLAEDINLAVDAAEAAFPSWAELEPTERARAMRALADRIREEKVKLLDVEVSDTGNTAAKMQFDVDMGADALEYFAGLVRETKGETIPATAKNLHFTLLEPYGVVGRIIPFNHPIMFAVSKMAAPLAAGNTVIIKPSERTPLSSLYLAELVQETMPPGVVNIVTGFGAGAGDALVRHPRVKRIAFTGSAATGQFIQRAAAESAVKQLSLELGGKNPLIVFPDADLSQAISAAVGGMNFAWQGQSCGSTSRLFLHDSVYDKGLEMLLEAVAKIRLGDPHDMASDMGPINSDMQYNKDLGYIDIAKQDGARLVAGGAPPAGKEFEKGYWLEPTVFADVKQEMRIFQEEVFGPVLSVVRWNTEEEVLKMANNVEYGLTSAIWTNDIKTALRMARRIQAGYVWINGSSAHYLGAPFGGWKNSGIGREESLEEMASYMELKSVHVIL